jgi:sugar O-acyltransferase (sialic acid O-acetyltransferase NeuD family)
MVSDILILGAGGHGRVVGEAALACGRWAGVAYLDNRYPELDDATIGTIIGTDDELQPLLGRYSDCAIALGDCRLRQTLLLQVLAFGYRLPTLVHPAAWVSPSAELHEGTFVAAGAIVQTMAKVGRGGIINTSASIDHDCILSETVHIAPGAHLGGGVTVGERTWVGIGASVREGISIGKDAMIAAGAVVVDDVLDGITVAGVPARKVPSSKRLGQ